MKRSPAAVVIQEFADVGVSCRAIARELGINASTVIRWPKPAPAGCDGLVPSKYHRSLLALAAEHGAALVSDDLVLGRR